MKNKIFLPINSLMAEAQLRTYMRERAELIKKKQSGEDVVKDLEEICSKISKMTGEKVSYLVRTPEENKQKNKELWDEVMEKQKKIAEEKRLANLEKARAKRAEKKKEKELAAIKESEPPEVLKEPEPEPEPEPEEEEPEPVKKVVKKKKKKPVVIVEQSSSDSDEEQNVVYIRRKKEKKPAPAPAPAPAPQVPQNYYAVPKPVVPDYRPKFWNVGAMM